MSLINALFLTFAGQGIFLAFLLSTNKKIQANPWIALYFLSFSFILFNWVIIWTEDINWKLKLVSFGNIFQFMIGPFLYFSIRKANKQSINPAWHFIPAILCVFILAPGWIGLFYKLPLPQWYLAYIRPITMSVHYSTLASIAIYTFIAYRIKKEPEDRWLAITLSVFLVGYASYDILRALQMMTDWIDYLICSLIVISFYSAGYFYFNKYRPYSSKKSMVVNLDDNQQLLQRINTHLQSKQSFLDPKYRMEDLASELNEPVAKLSQVIGQSSTKNFKEYINQMRINHAKELLISSDMKILAVAFESGYANKVSFIQNFKKFTGVTPSEYRLVEKEGENKLEIGKTG